jgi:hypothetical protein
MYLLNFPVGYFVEADQSTLTRGHSGNTCRYAFAGLCPRDFLMLVTRVPNVDGNTVRGTYIWFNSY